MPLSLMRLRLALGQILLADPDNTPVMLIVNGTAYLVDDVWVMPHAGPDQTPAVCIGEDPR